jgi:hypothetical protein
VILHNSVTADEPRAAAEALAELMGGAAFPFPEFGDKAWLAMAGDEHGTLVEVQERGKTLRYVPGGTVAHYMGHETRESGFHLLIETPHDFARVAAIAQERGFAAHVAKHGPLDIIEFWIDGCLLVEVATPQMAAAYRSLPHFPPQQPWPRDRPKQTIRENSHRERES